MELLRESEWAQRPVEMSSCHLEGPKASLKTRATAKSAFAFDIDGLLVRGGQPIPAAIEAMKVLDGQNQYGVKV